MVNMMREHTSMNTRIHYVITEGGSAPNVIPDSAEVFYYVRHSDADEVRALWERLEAAAEGAALGTGTEVSWEIIHGNNPLLVNQSLARMMDAKLRAVGGVTYTAEERAWAEEIAQSFGQQARPLESAGEIQPYGTTLGYGSTDVGDVSWTTPTVGVTAAGWVPGTSAHSWQAVAASGMSIGAKGAQVAAKSMALMAVELFENEELRRAARAEFDASRGADYVYRSLLGDRDPPLDFRR
jgi:aminobenzoyl-glutamate utilization protein B